MTLRIAAIAAMATALAGAAFAQQGPPETIGHAKPLAVEAAKPAGGAKLTVTSPAFKAGDDLPWENTQYRGNIFPGLNWSKGPAGTKSYVVVTQGMLGGPTSGNSIHFVLVNVPAGVTGLAKGLTTPPAGSMYGPNVHGENEAYSGPHTHGPERHDYHYQVLALDTLLPASPKMTYEAIEAGMVGHVLASGDVVAKSYRDPMAPPDPPPAPRPARPAA